MNKTFKTMTATAFVALTMLAANGFVTELPQRYTLFCFLAARNGVQTEEVFTIKSGDYAILSAFAVQVYN